MFSTKMKNSYSQPELLALPQEFSHIKNTGQQFFFFSFWHWKWRGRVKKHPILYCTTVLTARCDFKSFMRLYILAHKTLNFGAIFKFFGMHVQFLYTKMGFQKNVKNWSQLLSSKNGLISRNKLKNPFLGSKFCPIHSLVHVR